MREDMEVDRNISLSNSEETHLKNIHKIVDNAVRDWYRVVKTLGLNENDKIKWEEDLQVEYEACANDCLAVATDKQQALNEKIASLLEESARMCKQLSIMMPRFAPTNQGMYNDEKYLIELVKGWQDEISTRTKEIEDLKTRRDEISKTLGRRAFYIKESPLPSRQELEMYLTTIQELEKEKQQRIEKFRDLQEKITALSTEIQFIPRLDFERDIISGENLLFFEASDENMLRVVQFHQDLVDMRDNIEQDLNKLQETLENLWRVLEEDVKHCSDFIQAHVGLNFNTLEAFKAEVKRCERIRKTNLGKFIEKLRRELVELWQEAGFSQTKREAFAIHLEDNTFTEDLLTLHDMQIEGVKTYMKNNQKIFDLLKQRDVLYKRMSDLEERANAPNRFKNRGGQLLKEEKERKAVTKKIPVIEEQLLTLAIEYEENHGEKFMFWEDTIENLIERARDNQEQEKKLLMSTRKQKREVTMSATKITHTLYKSPIAQSSTRNFLTPHNTRTPMRTPKTLPAGKVLTGRRSINKAKFRMSTDKKRRVAAMRAKINSSKKENEHEVDYSQFENDMSKKDLDVRSTINVHSLHSSQPKPTIRVETPRTVNRALKAMASKAKLLF